jgi:Kef-type K+ transport system membrane component KefB
VPKSTVHVLTLLTSAVVMGVCLLIARLPGMRWLREWGLGVAILLGLTVAFLAQSAGLGPAG